MAFEGLSGRLSEVFQKLKGRGKVKESDVKEVMREVRMALLEADVNYKVTKDFVASVSEKALGSEVLESLTPAQQIIKIVNDPAHRADGLYQRPHQLRLEESDRHHDVRALQGAGKTTHCAQAGPVFSSPAASGRCWPPVMSTAPPPLSSSRSSASRPGSRCSRWGRGIRWRSPAGR